MDTTLPPPPVVPSAAVSAAPPRRARSWTRWGWLAVLPALVILYRFDPAQHGFYPQCHFKAATGLDCPGCGGLRATHALLHGEFAAAWRLNPLFVTALPLALLAWLGLVPAPLRERWRRWWLAALLVASVLFTVLRNL